MCDTFTIGVSRITGRLVTVLATLGIGTAGWFHLDFHLLAAVSLIADAIWFKLDLRLITDISPLANVAVHKFDFGLTLLAEILSLSAVAALDVVPARPVI